jgi:hypothetical protein
VFVFFGLGRALGAVWIVFRNLCHSNLRHNWPLIAD